MITYSFRFFPAAGRRHCEGSTGFRGWSGYYWSSTADNSSLGYYLNFNNDIASLNALQRTFTAAVRCVALWS